MAPIALTKERQKYWFNGLPHIGIINRPHDYVGPGDIIGGAMMWWGGRSYKASKIGTNAIRVRRSSDNTEQDFTTIEHGGLPSDALTVFAAGSTLFVKTLYDQTGNGFDLIQTNTSLQPQLTSSAIGSAYAIEATATKTMATTSQFSQAQPIFKSGVMKYTSDADMFFSLDTNTTQVRFLRANAGVVNIYAGGEFTVGRTYKNTWMAVRALYNAASSEFVINGDSNTGNAGSNGFTGPEGYTLFSGWVGFGAELGIWASNPTADQKGVLMVNQRSYWAI